MVEAVSKVTSTRKTEAVASANEKVEKKGSKRRNTKSKRNRQGRRKKICQKYNG